MNGDDGNDNAIEASAITERGVGSTSTRHSSTQDRATRRPETYGDAREIDRKIAEERGRYGRVSIGLMSTKELIDLAIDRHSKIPDDLEELPYRLVVAYAETLLAIRDELNRRIDNAERDERGLPIVTDPLRISESFGEWDGSGPDDSPDESELVWEPGTSMAGKLEAFYPFQYAPLWEEIVRLGRARTRRALEPRHVDLPACDPPESCDKRVRAIAPSAMPLREFEPPAEAPKKDRSERRIPPVDGLSLENARSIAKQVSLEDAYTSHGLQPREDLNTQSTLYSNLAGIVYIGPGFAGYFRPDGAVDASNSVGPAVEVDAVTRHEPGIYWHLPEGTFPRYATVRLDRGRVSRVPSFQGQVDLRSSEQAALERWAQSFRVQNKTFLFVLSRSYWHRRGGIMRVVGRIERAAIASLPYAVKEGGRLVDDLTVETVVHTAVFAVLSKIPFVNLAFINEDIADAIDFGRAAGMAAWGTAEEDIDVAARLMARAMVNVLVGEVVGRVVGKGIDRVRGKPRDIDGQTEPRQLPGDTESRPEPLELPAKSGGRPPPRPQSLRDRPSKTDVDKPELPAPGAQPQPGSEPTRARDPKMTPRSVEKRVGKDPRATEKRDTEPEQRAVDDGKEPAEEGQAEGTRQGALARSGEPELISFGDSERQELIQHWRREIENTRNNTLRQRYRGYIRRIKNGERPIWSQSEREMKYFYEQIGSASEVPFMFGHRTKRTKRGSTRPDVVTPRAMHEVKNYRLDDDRSVAGLIRSLRRQISARREHGPVDKKNQTVIIDARGQDVSHDRLLEVAERIARDPSIGLPIENIQIVTW